MELIKIELDNKIFKIPKPRTFQELHTKLSAKFGKTEMHRRTVCYKDTEDDEVIIETDSDIEVAFLPESKVERLLLKAAPDITEETPNALKNEDLGRIFMQLDTMIDHEKLKKVETCLEDGQLPCPICLSRSFDADTSRKLICKNCHGSGHLPMTKIWNLILFLIDCKVKEFLLNPLSDLLSEKSFGASKDDILEHNSTKVSNQLASHCNRERILQDHTHSSNIIPHDLFNKSDMWSGKVPSDDNKHKITDSSLLGLSFDAKSFKKQNTFIASNSDKFGAQAKNVNLSFPDYVRLDMKRQDDERFFTKEQLQYSMINGEAWLATANTVEVKLLIEGTSDKSWPIGVRIRGKDCELTKGVDIPLEKRLKPFCIIGIKFNFSVKCDLTDRIMAEPLCFEFTATDMAKNIKYFSRPLTLQLNLKKSSKINVCTMVR